MWLKILLIALLTGTIARKLPNDEDQRWVSKIVDGNFGIRNTNIQAPEFESKPHDAHDFERHDQNTDIRRNDDHHHHNSHKNRRIADTNTHRRIETGFDRDQREQTRLDDQRTRKPFITDLDYINDEKYNKSEKNDKTNQQVKNTREFNNQNIVTTPNTIINTNIITSIQNKNTSTYSIDTISGVMNTNIPVPDSSVFIMPQNRDASIPNNINSYFDIHNNRSINNFSNTEKKLMKDNEIVPNTTAKASISTPPEEDRWIWSNSESPTITTPATVGLDDRAAFSGDKCPTGKAKLGNMCVDKE